MKKTIFHLVIVLSSLAFVGKHPQNISIPRGTFFISLHSNNCQNCILPVLTQIRSHDSQAKISLVAPGYTGREYSYVLRTFIYWNSMVPGLNLINNRDTFNAVSAGGNISLVVYCKSDSCAMVDCFGDIQSFLKWVKNYE